MKMFVNKNMWNWKDVLAKTRDIGKVCYLKGNVVWKGELFEKVCYSTKGTSP